MKRKVDIIVSVEVPAEWDRERINKELFPIMSQVLRGVETEHVKAESATWEAEQRDGLPEL